MKKVLKYFILTLLTVVLVGGIYLTFQKESGGRYGIADQQVALALKPYTAKDKTTTGKKRVKANPVTKAVVKQAVKSYEKTATGTTKEILESMSAEDKDAVTEIIASNVSISTIADMQSYAAEGKTEDIMEYAKENFPEEDIEELEEIMKKYMQTEK